MRLFFFILCCLMLSGCKATNSIFYSLYVASIGFEHTEEGYSGYFFLPSSMDVGSTGEKSTDSASEVAKVDGKSISDVFYSLEVSSTLNINLKHISSIILHESMLNNEDIESFIQYIKQSPSFDYNFYIFTAVDEIKELYKIKNPNQESVILTMLVDPKESQYAFTSASPVHYLNFCRDFYNHKVMYFPLIKIKNIWGEEDDSNCGRGITFLSDGKSYSFECTEEPFDFLKDNKDLEFSDEKVSVLFDEYKIKYKHHKQGVKICVSVKYIPYYAKVDGSVEEYLKNLILEKIQTLISKYQEEIDFLNLKYYNCQDSKIDYDIQVKQQK